MPRRRRLPHELVVLTTSLAFAGGALAVVACSTDNGPAAYGETFGPLPERRDASATTADGAPAAPGDAEGGPSIGPDGAAPDAPATCTAGTLAVVAGSDTALAAAVQDRGGAWTTTMLQGVSKSLPAVVATTTGFLSVVRSTNDALAWSAFTTSWSPPSPIGAAQTIASPSLTSSGATVHLALLTPAFEQAYGAFASGAWSPAGSEVLQPPAGAKSFGPSAPSVVEAGGDVVVAFDGDDGGLYVQTRSGTTWAAASPIVGAGVTKSVPPVLLGWDGGSDLVLLFADNSADHVIRHAVRTAGTKAWSTVQNTGALAFTPEAFRAARISPTALAVTYRGGDGRAYAMTGTYASGAFTWSAPVALFAGATVDTAPAVAKGVCGDDAVAVAAKAGAVQIARLRSGVWSAAEDVPSLTATRVGVASR